ncbi:MAG TPA: carboxylating nicotinate-nucleotide diphosphorylase [Coriobacteriia bacterium]|nr:carboxylating nicotinate-nucleotide diphosphorylase [Coriobacteriia bacterium]
MFELPDASDVIAQALAEDLGVDPALFVPGAPAVPGLLEHDVTTYSTVEDGTGFAGVVRARQSCVVCGLSVAAAVYERLSASAGLFDPVEFFPLVAEGERVEAGAPVAEIEGLARAVLTGERVALDLMMVLSGIATRTADWVEAAGPQLAVYDTRKTLPGLRDLSKYAVRVGGGHNHRMGLYDMVLIKDNHLRAAGGVTPAIGRARLRQPSLTIEVEADSLDQAVEAVSAGADIVLLDNMDAAALDSAVAACRETAERRGRDVVLEVSGNITYERLEELSSAGVDRVSASALTLAPPVDFGLDESI